MTTEGVEGFVLNYVLNANDCLSRSNPATWSVKMTLSESQLCLVEDGLGIKAIAEDSAVMPQLAEAFGAHTFFLDSVGLCIVETDSTEGSDESLVIRLASWNEDRTVLTGSQTRGARSRH